MFSKHFVVISGKYNFSVLFWLLRKGRQYLTTRIKSITNPYWQATEIIFQDIAVCMLFSYWTRNNFSVYNQVTSTSSAISQNSVLPLSISPVQDESSQVQNVGADQIEIYYFFFFFVCVCVSVLFGSDQWKRPFHWHHTSCFNKRQLIHGWFGFVRGTGGWMNMRQVTDFRTWCCRPGPEPEL